MGIITSVPTCCKSHAGTREYFPLAPRPNEKTVPVARRRNDSQIDGFPSLEESFAWIDDEPKEYKFEDISHLPHVEDDRKKNYDFTGKCRKCTIH